MKRFAQGCVIIGLLLLTQVSARKQSEPPSSSLDVNAMKEIARLGQGFLVWERKLNGSWQIWTKQLDGSGEERLVPEEAGYDHFCPKISPDGAQLAYMSYVKGTTAYQDTGSRTGALWLMNLRNGTRKLVVPQARSYCEDRAVTWRDSQTFCYISASGETMEMNLEKNKTRKVIDYHSENFGYLPSPDLSHATTGTPEFAKLQENGTLVHQKMIEGCQPYFTSDSLWGYWMDGAGGPISAMFLATRQAHHILEKQDASLSKERNYVYFPMVSSCMRLLAFCSSTNEHDHFNGNYDVFIALINPVSLKLIGNPVHYTKFEGCDRFPDVYRRELELGTHFIESMGKVRFASEKTSLVCDFDFGDGTTGHGKTAEHVYKKPGDYWVTASYGKPDRRRVARGFVHVEPSTPPELVESERESANSLLLKFDRAVGIENAVVRIGKSAPLRLASTMLGRAVRVRLPDDLPDNASVTIEGMRGGPAPESVLPPKVIPLGAMGWPTVNNGLLFSWKNALSRESADGKGAALVSPRGLAFWDRYGAMKLRGGNFQAVEAGRRISDACSRTHAFTVETVIAAEVGADQKSESVILALSEVGSPPNLEIRQKGRRVSLYLRCSGAEDGDHQLLEDVIKIDSEEPHHMVFCYANGQVTAYIDGKKRRQQTANLGGLFQWRSQTLRFGADADGKRSWRGRLERVAFYDRALSDSEVAAHNQSLKNMILHRPRPREWEVVARLVEATRTPALADIQPYKEAMVRHLFQVEQAVSGNGTLPEQIVVAQWVWMGGTALPAQALKTGDRVRLTLHEMEAHPEVKALVIKDDLTQGFDARPFFDVSDWDRPYPKIGPGN